MERALARACENTGKSMPDRIDIIAITTSSSMSVNPCDRLNAMSLLRLKTTLWVRLVLCAEGPAPVLVRRLRRWFCSIRPAERL